MGLCISKMLLVTLRMDGGRGVAGMLLEGSCKSPGQRC